MTIRWYLDEDSMSHALVIALQSRAVDVITAGDANLMGYSDEANLEYSTTHQRTLYSFNIHDFFRIHAEVVGAGESHGGIVLCQQQRFSIGEQMRRIMKLSAALSADDMIDRIEFLTDWG